MSEHVSRPKYIESERVPDYGDLQNKRTFFQRPDRITDPLYVVTTIFNSPRFRTRWKLYQDFADMVEQSHARLYTCEVAFGDREFSVTDPCNPYHIQLRTKDELWLKENALNLMVQRLPADWKYVAWVDADIVFARQDWADETVHRLQHYPVVQMWSEAHDLGPEHELLQAHRSFAYSLQQDIPLPGPNDPYSGYGGEKVVWWHPGFAWATRRDIWDQLGGMLDFSPIGSADTLMAWGMIGKVSRFTDLHPPQYGKLVNVWGERAFRVVRGDVGMVPGTILHHWHGPKSKRGYHSRWKILTDVNFDPTVDLLRDWQGLWQIGDRSIELRKRLREYFHSRQEDSTHTGT